MRRQWEIKKMDHPNLAIDISHGWINGVVELYLLVLIWLLFNIHAFASGGWPRGKGFALLPGFPGDSVSQSRSWGGGTEHEATWLRGFPQKWEEHAICVNSWVCFHRPPAHSPGLKDSTEAERNTQRLVHLWSSEIFFRKPLPALCFLMMARKERIGMCVAFMF